MPRVEVSSFLLTTLDSAVSNWESLGSVWLSLDGPGMSPRPVMRKVVLAGQPDVSFPQILGTLEHRCIQALLMSLPHLKAMGGETPLFYRGQTCPCTCKPLPVLSCGFQISPGKPAHSAASLSSRLAVFSWDAS